MPRPASCPLIPRRGEIRYAIARAAALLSSLLLLANAVPLHENSNREQLSIASKSIERNVNTYIAQSLSHSYDSGTEESLNEFARQQEDVLIFVSASPSSSLPSAWAASPSTSVVPSVSASPSTSVAPSVSASPSTSIAPSTSASPSLSVSPSTSVLPSLSPSPSLSVSPTLSASPSGTMPPSISSAPTGASNATKAGNNTQIEVTNSATNSTVEQTVSQPSVSPTSILAAPQGRNLSISTPVASISVPIGSAAPPTPQTSSPGSWLGQSGVNKTISSAPLMSASAVPSSWLPSMTLVTPVVSPSSAASPLQSAAPAKSAASSAASSTTASGSSTIFAASSVSASPTLSNLAPVREERQTQAQSSPGDRIEPLASLVPVPPTDSPVSETMPGLAPAASPSVSPSPIVWIATQSSPVVSSTMSTPTTSPSSSPLLPAADPNSVGIQAIPTPKAGQNIIVFPILLQGSQTVSKKLDRCIRRLAAKKTETTPEEWSLVGIRERSAQGEIEARYAVSFPRDRSASVRAFELYVEQSMSKDIGRNCNINDVSIVGAGSIIAAVGVSPNVESSSVDRVIALASSLGGIALLMIVGGVLALIYGRRRNHESSGEFFPDESFTDSQDRSIPYVRPGLRFSSSREAGPGPHTTVEAMRELPIREIPMSEEGETVTSTTFTGYGDDSTSIYEDDDNSRSIDFHEGPSEHSLTAFTGAWGALAPGARSVSEPSLDDDENDGDYEEEVDYDSDGSSSMGGFDNGGHPEPPSSNSVDALGVSASTSHPHDYVIGIGPTDDSSPLPPQGYVVPDIDA